MADNERFPTLAGVVLANMDATTAKRDDVQRFPFFWWAAGAQFEYPKAASHLFSKTGSAAEAFFLRAFASCEGADFDQTSVTVSGLKVVPQATIAKYRVDFAAHETYMRLAIEIDGLAFHHRTAEQIEHDYLRARRVAAAGYSIVRFTAAEAFRDPAGCWFQVNAILKGGLSAMRKTG